MRTPLTRFGDLHVSVTPAQPGRGYLLYVHGGPGGHAAVHERAIAELEPLRRSGRGWICYDQRGCGRSGGGDGELSHERNVADLEALHDFIVGTEKLPLDAVVGHSYGAGLVYELFSRTPERPGHAVLVALAANRGLPRMRSLMMDLLALKMRQPDAYRELSAALAAHCDAGGNAWELHGRVRDAMTDTALRKHFYWANADALAWYERARAAVRVEDSDPVFRRVRDTLWASPQAMTPLELSALRVPVLWVQGLHDFLMGGESVTPATPAPSQRIVVFPGSGHYPHWEEPERFARELESFLG